MLFIKELINYFFFNYFSSIIYFLNNSESHLMSAALCCILVRVFIFSTKMMIVFNSNDHSIYLINDQYIQNFWHGVVLLLYNNSFRLVFLLAVQTIDNWGTWKNNWNTVKTTEIRKLEKKEIEGTIQSCLIGKGSL